MSIEQHMRVVVCRFCGARAEDCGGTCVSATTPNCHFVCHGDTTGRWPVEIAHDGSFLVPAEFNEYLKGVMQSCPPRPAATHPTDSSEAEQKLAPHPHSEDTTATGHDSEACS